MLQAFRENRSEDAFAQLVLRYTGLVYSVAKRRLSNSALAEDITQIVFIRFAKSPPKVASTGELMAWLHRTTLNVSIDTWRSETRRRARELHPVVMEPAAPQTTVWDELSPKLDEALNQLGDPDRQAILLRFFNAMSMREVGIALGVSEDAAKMRVGRALERLRTQVGAGGGAGPATVLGTWLAERSVEAVRVQLVARLEALKLPPVGGLGGLGVVMSALLRIPKFNLVAGTIVLAVIVASIVQLGRSLSTAPKLLAVDPGTNRIHNPVRTARPDANYLRPAAGGSEGAAMSPPRNVKMFFHVVEAESGEPLAGTKIHAAFFGAGGQGESHDLRTDASGTGAIPEPDDATRRNCANLFVTADGHVPKVVGFRNGAVPGDYTMKLDRAMSAGGLLVDEHGQAVSGVEILIQGPGNVRGQIENVDFQTCPVTSQWDGSWVCSYLPRDYTNEIRFILKKPGYATTFPVVPVAQVDLARLVLVMDHGFTVTGQITDAGGNPVGNAEVGIVDGDPDKCQSTATDDHGVFTLAGVPGDADSGQEPPVETNAAGGFVVRGLVAQGPRHADLVLQAGGFASQTVKADLVQTTNVVNFVLPRGNVFRGQVLDEVGAPVANAVVQTDYDFKNQIPKRFDWTTRTDGNGLFEWDSAPAGDICYWFEADGYKPIRGMALAADGSQHEVTLKPTAH